MRDLVSGIFIELVDYKDAAAAYKKALKLQPSNFDLYLGLASNSAAAGDKAGAIAAYQKYLKVDPHSQYGKQVQAALAQLVAKASPSPSTTP